MRFETLCNTYSKLFECCLPLIASRAFRSFGAERCVIGRGQNGNKERRQHGRNRQSSMLGVFMSLSAENFIVSVSLSYRLVRPVVRRPS